MIKGIFRYPGGKSKKSIRNKILSRFPKTYSEYRDIMVGGGGLFFAIDKSIKRWINDIDSHLISVYLALKNRPEDFICKCKEIKPHEDTEELIAINGGKKIHNARLKEIFDYLAKNEECDQALRYFFINRTVWAGRVNYEIESRMYFSNHDGWNIVNTNRLEEAADYLKDVKVTCSSYEDVLLSPGDDVLVYIDPPYYLNTKLSKNSQLYRFNFSVHDHKKLAEMVRTCKHKVIISYDNNSHIRNLYKGFNFKDEKWTYCGTSSADGQSETKKQGNELIITNY